MGSYVPPNFGSQRVGFVSADAPDQLRYERGGNSDERKHSPVSGADWPLAPEQPGAAQPDTEYPDALREIIAEAEGGA